MSLGLINLNSPHALLSQLTVTTEKLWKKKNSTEQGLKNQQKVITQSLERNQSNQNVSTYYGKNWKPINYNDENWCILDNNNSNDRKKKYKWW